MDWFESPEAEDAYQAVTDSVRAVVVPKVLTQLSGGNTLTPTEFQDMIDEVTPTPEFRAMIEAEMIRHTALVRDRVEESLEQQAVVAAQSGLHGYHPEHYANVEAMLEAALEGTRYHSSEWWNLKTLLRDVLPYCKRHGIDIPVNLWEEFKSKARYLADRLGPKLRQGESEELTQLAESLLAQVTDENVTVAQMKAAFPPTPPSQMAPFQVVEYIEPEGAGYVVIGYKDDAQRRFLERQLGKQDWSLGTGTEPFLAKLARLGGPRDSGSDLAVGRGGG